MKKYFSFVLWTVLASLAFVSCSDDDKEPAKEVITHKPLVQIESVTPSVDAVEIIFKVEDAQRAVYKVMVATEKQPTAAELLADKQAFSIGKDGKAQQNQLQPNTSYKVVAAAAHGEVQSPLVVKEFKTETATISQNYLFAMATYHGRDKATGTSNFIIDFSSKGYGDDSAPISHLYVTLTGDATQVDLKKLTLPIGTYKLGDPAAAAPGKFYAGVMQGDMAAGTFLATQLKSDEPIGVDLVTDGEITLSWVDETNYVYKMEAHFILQDGTKLEGVYESGVITVDNASGELPPAEELPLPESGLTGDVTGLQVVEAYYQSYGNARYGDLGKDEVYLMLYLDNSYMHSLDIFLLMDNKKYPDTFKLPVGEYPVMPWSESVGAELTAVAGYCVAGNGPGGKVALGCKYANKSVEAYLTGGNVKVESFDPATQKVKMTFAFKDEKGNTVSGSFEGKFQIL